MVSDEAAAELARRGLRVMAPDRALTGLGRALELDDAAVVVADVDWDRFLPPFTSRRPSPLLAALPEATHPAAPADTAQGHLLVEKLTKLPADARLQHLQDHVRGVAATALGHDGVQGIEPTRAFRDMGFDSLTAVELRDRLTQDTGLRLPTTLVFDQPTPSDLARYLAGELFGDGPENAAVLLAEVENAVSKIMLSGPDAQTLLKTRLRTLLTRLETTDTDPDDPSTEGMSMADRLDEASDEELFDLISRQLEQP